MPRAAVFLDRDDTIIDNRHATAGTAHPGDLMDPAIVRLLPGAAEGLRRLHDAGFPLVVVTNQGGMAGGAGTAADVEACNDRMRELLRADAGVTLAGVYYSPWRPGGRIKRFAGSHPWRKPAPGMLLAAAADLDLDLPESWMIGDAPRDTEAAVAAGLRPERCLLVGPGAPLPDLAAAAHTILSAGR